MLLKICYRLGGVLLIAGLLLPLWHFGLAAHVLAAGALLFGGAKLAEPRHDPLLTVRRLRRQQMLGALMLIITGALMLTRYYHIAPFRGNKRIAHCKKTKPQRAITRQTSKKIIGSYFVA